MTAGQSDHSATTRSTTPVLCIAKYSKGFLCSAGNGIVYMYEKTDEREFYKKAREIRILVSSDSAQNTINIKVTDKNPLSGMMLCTSDPIGHF